MSKDRLSDYDSTAANNTDVGGVNIQGTAATSNMDDGLREVMSHLADFAASDTIASATTTDLGSKSAQALTVSGTTTITGFGTVKAGTIKFLTFSGALTLTHNGTSLIIPGAANITTAAGDTAVMVSEGSGNWRCLSYQRAKAYDVLSRETTVTTVTNTTSETTIYSVTIPANLLSTDRAVRLTMILNYTKNSSGNLTINAKYGGSTAGSVTIADGDLSNSATTRTVSLDVFLMARGATGAQAARTSAMVGNNISKSSNSSETTVDSTSAQTFLVSVQFSAASTSLIASMRGAILEYL